jgi:hypothetical protein
MGVGMDPGTRHKLVAISRVSAFWLGAVVIGAGIEAAIGNVRAESVVWLVMLLSGGVLLAAALVTVALATH